MTERFARAVAAIDAANAEDPHRLMVRGELRPKERAHAEMVTEWILKLRPEASEALLLAGRAHHIRRWTIPRETYPAGRLGYIEWKNELRGMHARELRRILEECGYDEGTVARADAIIRKHGITRDEEVRTLEDALCLVFLETQFEETAAKVTREKMVEILRKSVRKMSARGVEEAAGLALPEHLRAMLLEAAGVG